jgi:hypothetical protein
MKHKLLLPLFLTLFTSILLAQNKEVSLDFLHVADEVELPVSDYLQTPSGTSVKIDRFSWYGSFPTLILDNGDEITCDQDYFIFRIDRGKQHLSAQLPNPAAIRSLRFYVGVDSSHNHLDPSSYPPVHPLAHQNPTMHWGWISGYIFQAFEGKTRKPGMNEESFFIHSIGNSLYRPVELPVFPMEEDGKWSIDIRIDLLRLIGSLDMHGLIAMGDFEENVFLFDQLQSAKVFYDPNEPISSSKEVYNDVSLLLAPNPISAGQSISIMASKKDMQADVTIYSVLGERVGFESLQSVEGRCFLKAPAKTGLYKLLFRFADGSIGSYSLVVD